VAGGTRRADDRPRPAERTGTVVVIVGATAPAAGKAK
jgi:hypothetical protein